NSAHLLNPSPAVFYRLRRSLVIWGMSDKRSVLPNFGVDQACADRQNLAPHKSCSRGSTTGQAALFKNEETRPRRLYDAASEPGTLAAGWAGEAGQECRGGGE